jgi:hypothetical protein
MAMLAVVAGLAVLADDQAGPSRRGDGAPYANPKAGARYAAKAAPAEPFAVREEEALAFVREHYPQLAALVEQLKAMRPDEYEKAINELYQDSRSLAGLKKLPDARRYEAALETWKAKSKVQVLAAQLASAPSDELEAQLRTALGKQLDAQLRNQKLERDTLQSRLRKLDEQIDRQEKNRDQLIESRFQGLVKKGQRVRRREGGNPAPSASSGAPRKTEP